MARREIEWRPRVLLASSLAGDKVVTTLQHEDVGKIEDCILHLETARIAHVVLWVAEIYASYGHKPFWN